MKVHQDLMFSSVTCMLRRSGQQQQLLGMQLMRTRAWWFLYCSNTGMAVILTLHARCSTRGHGERPARLLATTCCAAPGACLHAAHALPLWRRALCARANTCCCTLSCCCFCCCCNCSTLTASCWKRTILTWTETCMPACQKLLLLPPHSSTR